MCFNHMLILILAAISIWVIFNFTLTTFEANYLVLNVNISYFSKIRQISQAS